MKFPVLALLLIVSIGCERTVKRSDFIHDIKEGPAPWLHQDFDSGDDQFTFALISDLNGEERDGIFEVAVNQLNLLRPEFVLSVGDLIDGGTEDINKLQSEWDSFDERASKIHAPFFHLGGNHDLTNVVMRKFWAERYGSRYYHFLYRDVLFLMVDSEDFEEDRMQEIYLARAEAIRVLTGPEPANFEDTEYFSMPERSTGEISDEQSRYFEEVLKKYPEVRWTFVLMHKPVWRREGQGGFSRIESALGDRPYTVINGHLHSYSHELRNNRDYITLGTTGGGQNPRNENSFDHLTLVTVDGDGPTLVNLKMGAILDKTAAVPGKTDDMCFQASRCL